MNQQPTSVAPEPSQPVGVGAGWVAALYHATLLAPGATIAAVYALSIRAWMLLGYWPQPSVDDPKYIAPHDAAMTVLYGLVMAGLMWSFMSLALVPLLTALQSRTYSMRRLGVGLVVFGATWLILRLDPGGRMAWFGD